jgi:DNA-binding HxlR family transcriptional regulator
MAGKVPQTPKIYHCPVEATVDVAAGKWKPIIIFHLLGGTRRFGELRRLTGSVTQRSLTLQLRELEEDGIVRREVFAEVPPRVEYSLTEFGRTLAPVLRAMKKWGDAYVQRVGAVIVDAQFEIDP